MKGTLKYWRGSGNTRRGRRSGIPSRDRNYSEGALLRVRGEGGHERAECLWPSGAVDLLWEGPRRL